VYSDGRCKPCGQANNARRQRRVKLATALLDAALARGLSCTEAIAALQNIDYWTLQECVSKGIR
jgi:hypothetical protein